MTQLKCVLPGVRGRACAVLLTLSFIGGCTREPEFGEVAAPVMRPDKSTLGDQPGPDKYTTEWLGSRTVTVAPGIHALCRVFPSAVYAIETNEGVILIDSGSVEDGALVREGLLSVGLDVSDVRYILITHAHYDHVFGANKLSEMSGAVVAAGRDDCQVLREPDLDALYSLFPQLPYTGTPIRVDRELDDGDVIELGEATVRVIATPGHTPGSTCYLLEKGEQTILFSGDVIASLKFGPAIYPTNISPSFRGNAQDYLDSVSELLAMQPPDLLLTGHPRQNTQMQSIAMDNHRWVKLLEPAQAKLEETVQRHQRDGTDYLDDVPKEIEPGLYYLGQLDDIAVYCLHGNGKVIAINAPGDAGFAGFFSDRLESVGLQPGLPDVVLLTSDAVDHRSGLKSIEGIDSVIAPESVVPILQSEGLSSLSANDISSVVDLPIKSIATNESELCYQISINAKQIVFTPSVPRNVNLVWVNPVSGQKTSGPLQPQHGELTDALGESLGAARSYRDTLRRLNSLSPDIWLPSTPMTGQNANLYGDEWSTLIESNLRLAQDELQKTSYEPGN